MALMSKQKKQPGQQLPDVVSVGPACQNYVEAQAKHWEMHLRIEKLMEEIKSIRDRYPTGFKVGMSGTGMPLLPVEAPAAKHSKHLGKFAIKDPPRVVLDEEKDYARIDVLSSERSELMAADAELCTRTLPFLRLAANKEYLTAIRPNYAPIAAKIISALMLMGEAASEQDELFKDLRGRGIDLLGYIPVLEVPSWFEIVRQLANAAEGGWLDGKLIPQEWKDKR